MVILSVACATSFGCNTNKELYKRPPRDGTAFFHTVIGGGIPFLGNMQKKIKKRVKRILVVLKKCIFAIVNLKQLLSWNTASL